MHEHVGWQFNFLFDIYKLAFVILDSHSVTYVKWEMTNPIYINPVNQPNAAESSREAANWSACQEIQCLKVQSYVHKNKVSVHILSQANPLHMPLSMPLSSNGLLYFRFSHQEHAHVFWLLCMQHEPHLLHFDLLILTILLQLEVTTKTMTSLLSLIFLGCLCISRINHTMTEINSENQSILGSDTVSLGKWILTF